MVYVKFELVLEAFGGGLSLSTGSNPAIHKTLTLAPPGLARLRKQRTKTCFTREAFRIFGAESQQNDPLWALDEVENPNAMLAE